MTLRVVAVVVLILVMPACGGSSASSEDGYSPEERAIQFTEEWYRWNETVPPDDLMCTHTFTEDGGTQWFDCGPDKELHVFCRVGTTDTPLTGQSDRRRGVWGDCGFD